MNLLALTTGSQYSLLVARPTIRQLEADPTSYAYEEALHEARYSAAAGRRGAFVGAGPGTSLILNTPLGVHRIAIGPPAGCDEWVPCSTR